MYNVGIVSDQVSQVPAALDESKQDSKRDRLLLYEISVKSDSGRALGFERNVKQLRTPSTMERFGRIRKGLRCFLKRRRVGGWEIRGMNTCVEENGESIHYEEMDTGMRKPVATKHKQQSSPPSHSSSKMFVPIDQRKSNDIPAVDNVNQRSLLYRVSLTVTKILRHHGCHRENDGAN